jgi:hypothetical protein
MRRFDIGGICYRHLVRTEHMGSVMQLICGDGPLQIMWSGEMDYMHSSNLPAARAQWLRRRIAAGANLAVSMDSDTQLDGVQLRRCMSHIDDRTAIAIVPMRIGGGDGLTNVLGRGTMARMRTGHIAHEFFASDIPTCAVPIDTGGFGCAVFNLDWFRANWPSPTAERCKVDSEFGEDIDMCLAVRRRSTEERTVVMLKVDSMHHDIVESRNLEMKWR